MSKKKSRRFSFEGWEFLQWLSGNWKTIKELFKVGAPLLVGIINAWSPAAVGGFTILGKFLLDLGDYYLGEQS